MRLIYNSLRIRYSYSCRWNSFQFYYFDFNKCTSQIELAFQMCQNVSNVTQKSIRNNHTVLIVHITPLD